MIPSSNGKVDSSSISAVKLQKRNTAQAKRCRFALNSVSDESKRKTSILKHFSPSSDCLAQELRVPLSVEEAGDIMLKAATGRSLPKGLAFSSQSPGCPSGGTVFLHRSKGSFLHSDDYTWSQILFQPGLPTSRGNRIDFRIFYILRHGVPFPHFRKEVYSMGDLSLIAYIGSIPPSFSSESYTSLIFISEELLNGKFVRNLSIYPSLQITLLHPNMTELFEESVRQISGNQLIGPKVAVDIVGLPLFYDVTFPLGSLYVTLLTYSNSLFEGNPIMPLAINIHERQFKSSHQLFWSRILGDIPLLSKFRFPLLIDDGQPAVHLAIRSQAPNLVQLEGWHHRFRDLESFLYSKGYSGKACDYTKACIIYLLSSTSKQEMHEKYKSEFEPIWPHDFRTYYNERLLPRSGRLGRWAMALASIYEPHINATESFYSLLNNFSDWQSLRVDQVIRSFYYLFSFFVSEKYGQLRPKGSLSHSFKILSSSSSAPNEFIPHPSSLIPFIQRTFAQNFSESTQKECLMNERKDDVPSPAPCDPSIFTLPSFSFEKQVQMSMDSSSIVTESHYDASFETDVEGGTSSQMPTGLLLWRKVQHLVVFGGSFKHKIKKLPFELL